MNQDKHTARSPRWKLIAGAGLILLTLLLYSPSFHYPFINYDDPVYVYQNPHVQAGLTADGFRWAFTTFACGNWHPLTWLSLQWDAQLFGGQNAGAFHRTNVLLHAANTLLLFLILVRLTGAGGRSAVVAGLFALHPLHVESVAWVTERKDVLSTFFWFVTMAAYLFYLKRPSIRRYFLLMAALGLGLLAKPMLVTLPCVLLLLDYWPLRRWPHRGFPALLLEKAPLFVLVLASCIVTFYAQLHGNSVTPVEALPLAERLGNALLAYTSYLGKMLWPAHLGVHYPHAGLGVSVSQSVAAALLLGGVTVLVLGPGRRWPYLAVGWLWYLGTLVPVIGLVQVGSQGMADRYTYVPLIGVFLMLSWGAADLAAALHLPRSYLAATAVVVLSACAVRTWNQLGSWQSSRLLWECAAAAAEKSVLAHLNLGVCYSGEGRFVDAKRAFEKAVAIDPSLAEPHVNLGNSYGDLGQWDRAAEEFRAAVNLNPQLAPPHFNLGNALARLGQRDEAMAEYRRAIDLDPNEARPRINLGIQLDYFGRWEEAESAFRAAIERDPANPEAHVNLGILLLGMDRQSEALAEFSRAVALDPKNSRYRIQLAGLLQEMGRLDEALAEYQTALNLGDMQAQSRLRACARLWMLRPRLADVIAGRAQPADNAERLAFAVLCSQQRLYARAARLYREAFDIEPSLVVGTFSAHRWHAAAAAAAAGCGRNAVPLPEPEMMKLRRQSLEWLQAQVSYWTQLSQSEGPEARVAMGRMLRMLQRDSHFIGVRDPAALAQRPESERQNWRKLWGEVEALLVQLDSTRTK